MTHTTFNEIQSQLILNLREQRDAIERQLNLAKSQYTFACKNYGVSSMQSGGYDKIVCSLQVVMEALKEI